MKKLEIARSDEWKQLIKDMTGKLEDYNKVVIAKARVPSNGELGIAIGKHDGFLEAIVYLEGFGGT